MKLSKLNNLVENLRSKGLNVNKMTVLEFIMEVRKNG